MRVFRLCKAKHTVHAFDGEGARRYAGRWNLAGTPVVYCSATLSLAALEALVGFDRSDAPSDYVSFEVDVPESTRIDVIRAEELPEDWNSYPAPEELALRGRQWIDEGHSAVLQVPSAVLPSEWNYVLNPAHRDFVKLVFHPPRPFSFDPRLLAD